MQGEAWAARGAGERGAGCEASGQERVLGWGRDGVLPGEPWGPARVGGQDVARRVVCQQCLVGGKGEAGPDGGRAMSWDPW